MLPTTAQLAFLKTQGSLSDNDEQYNSVRVKKSIEHVPTVMELLMKSCEKKES